MNNSPDEKLVSIMNLCTSEIFPWEMSIERIVVNFGGVIIEIRAFGGEIP